MKKTLQFYQDVFNLAANVPLPGARTQDGEAAISSIIAKTEATVLLNLLAQHRPIDLHHSKPAGLARPSLYLNPSGQP